MWSVYILKCSDNTLYTGITNNLEKRLDAHSQGIGAKYTRCRLPIRLVYVEEQPDRSAASKRELEIKSFSRAKKNQLILKS
jgi:putative endonuclease